METRRALARHVGSRDMNKIPQDVLKKIESFCEIHNKTLNKELADTKSKLNETQKNIGKCSLISKPDPIRLYLLFLCT